MADIGTVTVNVLPEIDPAAFRDVAVLVAAVRLHEAMFHADIEWLKALPMPVQNAFGDLQESLRRVGSSV